MLFVTHYQEEAIGLAGRIGLMKEGKILQIGTGEELYRNPVNDYVRNFFGESNCISYQGVEYPLRPEEIGMENDTERVEALSGRIGKREEQIVLEGIIQSVQFLAIMKQYLVEWEGRTIKVKISSYAPFQNGESVRLFFHRTEAVLFIWTMQRPVRKNRSLFTMQCFMRWDTWGMREEQPMVRPMLLPKRFLKRESY